MRRIRIWRFIFINNLFFFFKGRMKIFERLLMWYLKKKEKKSVDVWSKIRQTTVSLFFTSVRRVCQSGGCTSAIKFFSNRHSFTSARRDERWQLPKCLIVSIEFRPREISRPITATRNRSLGHCESQRVEMKFLSLGTVNGETGPQKLSHFTPIRLLLH